MNDRLLHTPEGVRDIHQENALLKDELQHRILSVFHSYGFMDVQTPTFEYFDIFSFERGTLDTKLMYKFFDRAGHILALRPDITPSIARMVATSYKSDDQPKRFCYLGNTFRNNESYQGKLTEFTQAGVELIGIDSADADAEVIALVINSLLVSGLEEFQVDIGQAGFFKGLVEEVGLSPALEEEIRRLIDEKNYIAVEEVLDEVQLDQRHKDVFLGLSKLFGSVDVIEKAKKLTNNVNALASLERLEKVYSILCDYGVEKYVSFDLGMVTHLNYYTGVIFRGYTYGTGVSVVDGGRYNNLLSHFGKNTPAIGFAFIIDELMLALERQNIELPTDGIDTLLLYNEESRKIAIGIAESMRVQEMNIEVGLLDKSLEENIVYGKNKKIGGILHFISDQEVELINLDTDERSTFSVDELFEDVDPHEHHSCDEHADDTECNCGCHE